MIEKTDLAIAELVCDKEELRKAYNYYNCKRDAEQFKYLEDNYGIGLPTLVEFIPLIKKHVDALIGEYLDVPILPKVSCKDEKTLNNIFREKQLKIASECYKLLLSNLKNNILRLMGDLQMQDLNIKQLLDKLKEDIEDNFISEYETAGQNIVEYIILSRNIDLANKLRQLFIDVLVTGYDFYRVTPSGKNINIEIYSPLDAFPELNYDSPYINQSRRIVLRKYMSRNEILNKYGKLLTKEDREKIKEQWKDYIDYTSYYVRTMKDSCGIPMTSGIRAGEEISPTYNGEYWYNRDIIPVYDVEWLEVDKNFIMLRYQTIRIGSEIYILKGLDKNVIRTQDAPEKATLSVNGVWYNNRGKEPYSMVLNCMVLQD